MCKQLMCCWMCEADNVYVRGEYIMQNTGIWCQNANPCCKIHSGECWYIWLWNAYILLMMTCCIKLDVSAFCMHRNRGHMKKEISRIFFSWRCFHGLKRKSFKTIRIGSCDTTDSVSEHGRWWQWFFLGHRLICEMKTSNCRKNMIFKYTRGFMIRNIDLGMRIG